MTNARSVLLITLDSCRHDAFVAAAAPNMKALGTIHRAQAPSNFTYGSHASMFVGFTPGVPERAEPYVNPKYGRLFKLEMQGFAGMAEPYFALSGRSIVAGFRRKGYRTLGSAAMSWFDPDIEAGRLLIEDFDEFLYVGRKGLAAQLAWAEEGIARADDMPTFLFLNIGETHVPYWHEGADWDARINPCRPFRGETNDAAECRRRQIACIEYVDRLLGPLLERFARATTVLCADHGDCWGEDGLWEHGITHPKVMEVPLLFRLGARG